MLRPGRISVLFSEPKIPQCVVTALARCITRNFSALQRAENSSIGSGKEGSNRGVEISVLFSEPKIPQFYPYTRDYIARAVDFSALQRAENSSMMLCCDTAARPTAFQCSSASRKFLNRCGVRRISSFALISVLFSEPKIPQSERLRKALRKMRNFSALQRAENSSILRRRRHLGNSGAISVLFSEPKIPQCCSAASGCTRRNDFSALQRAENSSMT